MRCNEHSVRPRDEFEGIDLDHDDALDTCIRRKRPLSNSEVTPMGATKRHV